MAIDINKRSSLRQYLVEQFAFEASAAGALEGIRPLRILGRATDIDTGDSGATVWPDNSPYPFQTSPFQLELVSSSNEDFVGGLGDARYAVIGLDANGDVANELISLQGLTPVQTVRTNWLRINELRPFAGVGGSGSNVGTIEATTVVGGALQSIILPAEGGSRVLTFAVPNGETLFLTSAQGAIIRSGQSVSVEFGIFSRLRGGPFGASPWTIRAHWACRANGYSQVRDNFATPIIIGEGSELDVRVLDISANNVTVLATLEGFLIDNDILQPV